MRLKKLRFRDELIPLILSGRKRATIRLGTKSLNGDPLTPRLRRVKL